MRRSTAPGCTAAPPARSNRWWRGWRQRPPAPPRWCSTLAGTDLQSYLADPGRGSIHSFGMALDITIVDAAGCELDMGTGFDDLTARSHPALEALMLARGEITREHVANRQLLRAAMAQAGFHGIESEWWHFDCGERDVVRQTFQRVL